MKWFWSTSRMVLVFIYAFISMVPILWLGITSIKSPADVNKLPPRFIPDKSAPPETYRFRFSWKNYQKIFGSEESRQYLFNSVVVSAVSTFISVFVGAFAAYGFSRFRFKGSKDWQFFILSTRMLPPLAVAVPISWMYSRIGLMDTRFGLILLYTCFNLSFSTWMMKAFMDEIPVAYEEAAMLDGYSRLQVLFKIVLPQASTGLLATAVFCLITSWNEYAFALTLTSTEAVTMPVQLHAIIGNTSTIPWGPLAAGAVLFMLPIVVFSLLMRKHLLRGVTFGAVKG